MEFSLDFSVMVALATSAILSSFVTVYFFRKTQTKQSLKEKARTTKCGTSDADAPQADDIIEVQQIQPSYSTLSNRTNKQDTNQFGDPTKPLEIINVYQRRLQDETEKRKALESQCDDLQNRLRNSELAAQTAKDMHDKLLKRYNVVSQKLKTAEERCRALYQALNEAGIPDDEGYAQDHVIYVSHSAEVTDDAFGCDRSSPECTELSSESDDSLGYQASAGSSDEDADDESREFGDEQDISEAEFELSNNVMQLLVAETIKQPHVVEGSRQSPRGDGSYGEQTENIVVYNALANQLKGDDDDLSDLLESNPPTDEDEDIDELVARNSTDEDDVTKQLQSTANRLRCHDDDDDEDCQRELRGMNQGVVSERIQEVASCRKMWEQRFAEQNSPMSGRRFLDVPAGDRSNSSSRSASPAFLERLSRAEKRSNSPTIYDTVENHERSCSPSFYNSSRSNSPLAEKCAKFEQRPHTSDSDSDHEPARVRRRGSPRLSENDVVKDGLVSELRQQWEPTL